MGRRFSIGRSTASPCTPGRRDCDRLAIAAFVEFQRCADLRHSAEIRLTEAARTVWWETVRATSSVVWCLPACTLKFGQLRLGRLKVLCGEPSRENQKSDVRADSSETKCSSSAHLEYPPNKDVLAARFIVLTSYPKRFGRALRDSKSTVKNTGIDLGRRMRGAIEISMT